MSTNPFVRVLQALHDNDIRYIVAGGFAAVMYGCNRFTADLDLIVDLDAEHARKTIETLLGLGLEPRLPVDPYAFADAATRRRWIEEKQVLVFTLFDPTAPTFSVDLFIDPPEDFEELRRRSLLVPFRGSQISVCSLDDLIAMKKKAGRTQDVADIQDLERLRHYRSQS